MKVIATLILLFSVTAFYAQQKSTGSIQGKILDGTTGETIPFAEVELIPGNRKTSSDMDGIYTFEQLVKGSYSVKVKYMGFPDITITEIQVIPGEVAIIDVTLQDTLKKSTEIEEFVVTAERNRESVTDFLLDRKKAPNVSDGIPAEMIKRTPDRSAGDVLKRVSGASIQDNKFAVIRGLNDRYNAAYINGAPLPSSESDRKAFSFDIFPANMLDNLLISKTATPDQPAEFAGGIIQINTKSIPEKAFYSIAVGGGYNTLTTFKSGMTYKGSSTDWLGIDNGSRSLPSAIPAFGSFPLSISGQAALAQQFSSSWTMMDKKYAPNYNLQLSMGLRPKLFDRELGIIAALTYSRNFSYNETVRRGYTNSTEPGSQASQIDYDYLDKNNSEQVLAGALANFTYKLNENNTIGFKNLYSINSDDKLINRTGSTNPLESNPTLLRSNARWFTSNNIYSGQLNGEHMIKKSRLRIEWLAGYSNIVRTIPNLRRSIYTRLTTINDPNDPNPLDTVYTANISYTNVGPSYGGGMFFSENHENSKSFKTDVTYPTVLFSRIPTEIKAGALLQTRARDFSARQLGYTRYGVVGGNINFKESLLYLPEDQIFASENMGLLQAPSSGTNGVGGFKLTDGTKYSDAYKAQSQLYAGYVMLDHRFENNMRVVWGVRMEQFNQKLQAKKADNSDLDLRTKKTDFLPSLNYIYSISRKQNLRFSYSQTLNRPEYRELAPFAFFDFTTNFVVSGNDSLQRAKIQNLDLRYEFFPGRGQLISATVFYKHFTNPIEQISRADVTSEISYRNLPSAQNYGIELEARSLISSILKSDSGSFFEQWTIYSNLAVIRSLVDVSGVIGSTSDTRPLQGQSPYVFNAGLYYNNPRHNWGLSVSVNRVGARIAIVGNVNEPDLWENSRTFLDVQLSKTFWNNRAEFKLNAQNLLAQKQEFYQNTTSSGETHGVGGFLNTVFTGDKNNRNGLNNTDDVVWSTIFGRTFSASLSIRF